MLRLFKMVFFYLKQFSPFSRVKNTFNTGTGLNKGSSKSPDFLFDCSLSPKKMCFFKYFYLLPYDCLKCRSLCLNFTFYLKLI